MKRVDNNPGEAPGWISRCSVREAACAPDSEPPEGRGPAFSVSVTPGSSARVLLPGPVQKHKPIRFGFGGFPEATGLWATCRVHRSVRPSLRQLSLKVTPPKPGNFGFKNHFDLIFYREHGRLSEFNLSLSFNTLRVGHLLTYLTKL